MLFYRPQPLYAVILVQDHNRGNAILLELCHLKLVHKTLFIALTVHKKPRSQISKEIALLMHKD